MKFILAFIIAFCFVPAFSQSEYYHSIEDYQTNYKKDLTEIIQNDTAFVRFFPIDPEYKVIGTVKKLEGEPTFKMATSSGITKEAQKIAAVSFELHGTTFTLFAYQLLALKSSKQYKENFFIPFFDATNGDESYGGGRYLDFNLPDIVNDRLVIDFNKAYNPYCAFKTGYNCPIPPRENGLKVPIKAGEKNYGKSNH